MKHHYSFIIPIIGLIIYFIIYNIFLVDVTKGFLLNIYCPVAIIWSGIYIGHGIDEDIYEKEQKILKKKKIQEDRRLRAFNLINRFPKSARKILKKRLDINWSSSRIISLSDITDVIAWALLSSKIDFEKEECQINPVFLAKKRKEQAISLFHKFPEATKLYFKQHWDIDKYSLTESDITDDKVDVLLSHEQEYKDVNEQCILKRKKIEQEILELKKQQERLQKLAREETERQIVIERQRQIEIESKSEILKRVSNWDTIKGILHFDYLVIYYPTTCTHKVSNIAWNNRKMIWNFKNTPGKTSKYDHLDAMTNVQYLLTNKLESTFSTNLLKFITFVCIPASTSEKTRLRYEEFSKRVCDATGMMNAYNYMEVIHDCSEKKFGGSGILTDNIHFDQNFFKGKYVLIFDDVITKGDSMLRFKNKMESLGATVIAGIAIGLTVHN